MNICEHLTTPARLIPSNTALVFEGRRYSFAELDGLSRSAADVLSRAGVSRGARVAILLPNVPAFVVWYYATLRIGAIAVSISTRLAAAEVAYVISDCDARTLVAIPQTLDAIRGELPECIQESIAAAESGDAHDDRSLLPIPSDPSTWVETEPDDPALILYTSGTTGFAKGATLSHLNVRSNVHAFNHLCGMQSDDRILLAVPLFHCFGQNALLNSALHAGATLVLQRKFDLSESKRLIAEERITQLYGVPMMFQLFQESCEPADLASVDYCFSAAATLPIQTSRRWQQKFGQPIYEGYGLTETSPFASYNHRLKFTPGSIGTPIDCVEMKIVDTETGATCPVGELGEIAIRGPNVMLGYWNRPTETANTIRDGWFHSGDIGRVDEHGFFYIVDRVKDMIAVGGMKVYPAEVERVLLDHPSVSQAAVVGLPDEVFGEQVVAAIVPTPEFAGLNESLMREIITLAQKNLANYKVPRRVVLMAELPRNPAGKILKTELRKMDFSTSVELASSDEPNPHNRSGPGTDSPNPVRKPTLRTQLAATHASSRTEVANTFVRKLVQAIAETDALPDPQTRFLDAGLDSLGIVEMSSQIQAELGPEVEISATLVFDHPRITDLGEFLVNQMMPTETINDRPTNRQTDHPVVNENLQAEVAGMTEQQALAELMKELEA